MIKRTLAIIFIFLATLAVSAWSDSWGPRMQEQGRIDVGDSYVMHAVCDRGNGTMLYVLYAKSATNVPAVTMQVNGCTKVQAEKQ